MDTVVWVAVGFAVYWFALLAIRANGLLPSYVGMQGPILTVHTKRGKRLLERLARPKRFWRAWGNFGLGIALVVMVGTFVLFVAQAILVVQNPPEPTAVTQPRNALVIPGVNDFLPLSMAPEILFGLFVGLVVHEGGHGIFCRVEDIEIESMGLALLAFLPIGAFVEPDEEDRRNADRGSQSRMFAAGVTNNFAVTVVAFLLLFGPVMGAVGVAPGAAVGGVFPDSAADDADIQRGDSIVAINGTNVGGNDDLDAALAQTGSREVTVTVERDGEKSTTTVDRELLVTGIAHDSPLAEEVNKGWTVTAVNGTEVRTEGELTRELADRKTATFRATNGTDERTVTAPVGVLTKVEPNGPTASSSALSGGDSVVITAIDGQRVANSSDLSRVLSNFEPGQSVTVEAYVKQGNDFQRNQYEVTLGESENGAFLGVLASPGVSGVTADDFGTKLYPAEEFHGILTGELLTMAGIGNGGPLTSFLAGVVGALLLPFASISIGLEYNFAGFVGWNNGFYTLQGPLSALDGGVFMLANVLFWTGWINLNLGFFNCLPAFPLDGGHILRMGAEAVVSRLPTSQGRQVTTVITTTVGLVMLTSLLLMMFGPRLLAG